MFLPTRLLGGVLPHQVRGQGPSEISWNTVQKNNSYLIIDLVRFILILSHKGPLAIAAEVPDPHLSHLGGPGPGPGRVEDG